MNYQKSVIPILKEVGVELRKQHGNPEGVEEKSSHPMDLVTALDKSTETRIATALRELDSTIEFVGEEFGGNDKAERFWLCDPIDGTTHFVRGTPFCSTMLCLIEEEQIVFSAIYNFVADEMYVAEKGTGATKNGVPIHVSNRPLQGAFVEVEMKTLAPGQLEIFHKLVNTCMVPNTINAGYGYTMVASGKFDGRVTLEVCGKMWDYAPGSFLVQEAGGIVTNQGSETYNFRNLQSFAVNPVIYKELTQGENALFPVEK